MLSTLLLGLLAATAATRTAGAQSAPAAPAAPAASPAPTPAVPRPVPIPEIAARAEQVTEALRGIDRGLAPTPLLEQIEAELPDIAERIAVRREDTTLLVGDGAQLQVLDRLSGSWQTMRSQLFDWNQTLTQRAKQLEEALAMLSARREEWLVTRSDAVASQAPGSVVDRIDATLGALRAAQQRVALRRGEILTLQDKVATQLVACERALAEITDARLERVGRLLVRDTRPVWQLDAGTRARREFWPRLRDSIWFSWREMLEFAGVRIGSIGAQILLAVLLALLFRGARQRSRAWIEEEPELEHTLQVFARPYSSAIILAIVAGVALNPQAPFLFALIAKLLALIPALRVLRPVAPPPLRPFVYVLAGFYVADQFRDLTAALPQLEQVLLVVEFSAALAIIAWILVGAKARRERVFAATRIPYPTAIARLFLTILGAAVIAAATGYTQLARLLGGSVLSSTYIALMLLAAMRALDGLVAIALRSRPLRLLNMVHRHRSLIEHRAHVAITWLWALAWGYALLQTLALGGIALAAWRLLIETDAAPGEARIAIGDAVAIGLTIWAALLLSRLLRFVLAEEIYPRFGLPRGIPYAISTVLHYLLLTGGFLLALGVIGLDLNRFTILAGAFGVGIGFGLQNIVNNFTSGLILLFERPIQVGDTIEVGATLGEVHRIGIRSSTVRTAQGAEVIVPNANLIADPVVNWTLSDRTRRIDIPVGVAYGSDPKTVLELLRGVARENPAIVAEPTPVALFQGFGDSSLDFELRAWTNRYEQWPMVRSDLAVAIHDTLRAAGIGIPFPQRDVNLRVRSDSDSELPPPITRPPRT